MADSTLSNLTSLTLPSQATDLLLVGRGTARPNKVAMSDALNSAALAATTSTYGVAQLAADGGTTAGTVVQATDARLSNARNPPDGSKGDIVVSGSGSTWTIKTNPTLSGTVSADIVRVGDGTAAAPSLSFTNDSNTGFYKVAAATDVLYFAANGGGSLRFTTNGSIYSGVNNSYLQLNPSGDIYASVDGTTNGSLVLEPRGTGNVVIRNLSGIGNRTRLEIAQSGLRVFHLEVTGATADLAFGDGGGEYFRLAANSGYSVLFGKTATSNNGRIQLADHTTTAGGIGFGADISLSRSAAAQLDLTVSSGAPTFRFMNGAVYRGYVGTNGATTVLNSQSGEIQLQTSNAIALLLSANQNATFYKDVFLGVNGASVPGTLSARAPRQGLVFDGSATANASTVAAIGSGDYTVHVVFKAASPTSPLSLVRVGQAGVAAGFVFGTTDNTPAGRLVVRNGDASAQIFGATVLTANRWYAATAVRASGVVTIYLNGQGDVTGSLATNYSNGIGGMTIHGSTGNYAGTVETAIIYNRALSQDEVRQLYENGAPAAQDIVPQVAGTQLITGNNSTFAGAGSWTATFGSGTSTVSGGKLLINGGATTYGGSGFMGAALSGTYFVKGYRYRVTVDIDALSSGTLNICEGTGLAPLVTFSGTGTKTADVLVPMSSTDASVVLCFSVASATATIDNITLVPLGAVIAPDATQTGSGLTWYDTSGNAANITLPASGVRWNVPFNGRIQFADGTTAAPSLTFSSAPTTGFFRLSSTQIGCTFSGALAGYIWSPSANTIRFSGNSQGYFESASAGAMSVVAGGTNQSISLNPSGTGIATVVSSALNQPAVMRLTVPGTATAGAYTSFYRTGVIEWQAGVGTDNSSFRISPNGLGISDSLVLTNLGNATIGGTLTVNGGATAIVGAAGGTTTYTVLRNSATNISIWGSRASIDGGNAADVGLYVYGANELSFWTNSTRSAWISGSSVFNTVGGANFGGNTAVVNSADARILAQRTALSLNTISQVVLAQGSTLFGASDRTYQLVSNGESATAAYFGIQYWNGSTYALRFQIDSAGAAVVNSPSALASAEIGNFRIADSSNSNRKLFFGIDNTVAPSGVGYIQAVLTGTTTLPLIIQPNGGSTLFGTATNSSNGRIQLATHTANTGGIGFGTDVTLYRSAANTLKTDGNFNIGGTVSATSSASNYEWNISSSGVGGPFITLDATNATASNRFTGLLLKNNGTLEWTAQLRFGDSKFHVYDAVRNVSALTIAQGALSGVAGLSTFAGKVTITDSTASTAYNTGCLTLSGGFGVQGNSYFGGTVNVGTTLVIGTIGTGSFSAGAIYKNSSLGLVVGTIAGSTHDLFLTDPSGQYIMQVPTGTRNVQFAGTLTTVGNITSGAAVITSAPVGGAGAWELGVYTATAPTATGYVTIEIGGVQYKLLAAT